MRFTEIVVTSTAVASVIVAGGRSQMADRVNVRRNIEVHI